MIENKWYQLIHKEFEQEYFQRLKAFLIEEYKNYQVYPPEKAILHAIETTDYDDVKVVILGQDPYHNPNQAHGLSFSVQKGVPLPPSLRNIYKELETDIGCPVATHGNLEHWANQGVLLLNTVLTVRQGQAHSHKNMGWETFTDYLISLLNEREKPVIFILWGRAAQQKKRLITKGHHHIIQSVHPSPLSASRGFFGSKPFSQVNQLLETMGEKKIDWVIKD